MIVNEEYAQGMQMEAREQDGDVSMRSKWRPSRTHPAADEARPAPPDHNVANTNEPTPSAGASGRTAAADEELSAADLAVLKTLPPYGQRRTSRAA